MTTITKNVLVATGLLVFAAGRAEAAPLTIGQISGGWENAASTGASAGACVDIDNQIGSLTDSVRWNGDTLVDVGGAPGGNACGTASNTATPASGYDFDPIDSTYTFPDPNALATPFILGTFTHFNVVVEKAISSVDYRLVFDTNGVPGAVTTVLNFAHDETDNNKSGPSQCAGGPAGPSVSTCDDFVTVAPSLNTVINVGGTDYFFSLLGFSQDNGKTFSNTFQSPEGGTNSAPLYAVVTAAPVPEPATLLMLGSGLVGLGAAARRRMKKRNADRV